MKRIDFTLKSINFGEGHLKPEGIIFRENANLM